MVLPWGRPSRRWRSLSTRSTCAPSVARTRWRGRPPASGSATTRTAESRWLEVPTLTPPPPQPPSGRWKKNGKYFSKQQQHSVFPLNVGESNFSCCEIAWSSIHRIYIVCVRIIMDHTMSADRLLYSLSHISIIISSLSGLLWGGWGRWRRPKCCVHRPSFVPLKAARTIQSCDLHCFWASASLCFCVAAEYDIQPVAVSEVQVQRWWPFDQSLTRPKSWLHTRWLGPDIIHYDE